MRDENLLRSYDQLALFQAAQAGNSGVEKSSGGGTRADLAMARKTAARSLSRPARRAAQVEVDGQ